MDIASLWQQSGMNAGLSAQLSDIFARHSRKAGQNSSAGPPSLLAQTPRPSLPAAGMDYGATYQRETLAERMAVASSSYRLEITTADGRSASLSFDYAAFSYEQQYSRESLSATGQARYSSGIAASRELLAQQSQSTYTGISGSAFDLQISGDTSLLADYFAAAPTAQRIFDFAAGLGKGITFGDDAFAPFAEAIQQGIANGFAQAHAALGSLSQVSQDTQTLLDAMLARFRGSGERSLATDFLDLLLPVDTKN